MRRLAAALTTTAFLGLVATTAHPGAALASSHRPAPAAVRHATAPHATAPHAAAPHAAALALSGVAYLAGIANLQPTASGTWVNTGPAVLLPVAGTYALDANVRSVLAGTPPVNTFIVARLRNATTGTVLPNSARIANQVLDTNAGARPTGQNTTAPISERVTVTGPTVIGLQAMRANALGASSVAQLLSDANGFTSLRFQRIAP
ncbi:MAG TPA: hypothetical protein VF069_26710 [Streptosporangiaceae bacterium]